MDRKEFIKLFSATAAMTALGDLKGLSAALPSQGKPMPVFFIGHGSPMNGIEDNEFSQRWKKIGTEIPRPKAVLVVSAHWLTKGTHVTAMDRPQTIHDFGGFPDALFKVQYPAPGAPHLAKETATLVKATHIGMDHDWGLDHGTWTIVRHMYPDASIPVIQLSIDYTKPPQYHYELAKELGALRRKGVLILGSGNMVHNLRMIAWDKADKPEYGFDWALEINHKFKEHIRTGNHKALIDYRSLGAAALQAIPSPDHYYPLLYVLGLQEKSDQVSFFNDKAVMGSLTMTSVQIGLA